MKKILLIIISISIFQTGYGQFGDNLIDFEDTISFDMLNIDFVANPSNIWQIGRPQKAIFNSAYSFPNAIVTDTLSFYPVNDTSSFIIQHYADNGFTFPHTAGISFLYKMNSDSIVDYGIIEFSPNNGTTWINLCEDTVDIPGYLDNNFPIGRLSGNTNGWSGFDLSLNFMGSYFGIENGDTILYRFTYISDNIQNNKEGWMIDNIRLYDWAESIGENNISTDRIKIYPNPTSDILTIENNDKQHSQIEIFIYDESGQIALMEKFKINDKVHVNLSGLKSGIYIYEIIYVDNLNTNKGKLIIK